MAIVRMISRDLEEFRAFQADMVPLGKIRTGVFATPAGKRGRPEKLDRFRFTSPHRDLIEAVAAEYGGEVRPWSPDRDANRKEWEVISDADELDVYIINGQKIDPTYESWAAGRTCVRRCDGVWDVISQDHCVCNGPDRPSDPQKLCKITTRVKVMLCRVPGVGSWMYESHGEYFAIENGGLLAELVARAPEPVRSLLRLELERRREPDREKGGFKTKEFYVARFRTVAATPQQALTGGEALRQALTAVPVPAIEAAPAGGAERSSPVADAPPPVPAVSEVSPDLLRKILGSIEACTDEDGLQAVKEKLKARGITDRRVRDAWKSKLAGVRAERETREPTAGEAAWRPPGQDGDMFVAHRVLVTGSRDWTDAMAIARELSKQLLQHPDMVLVHGHCPTGADRIADGWAEQHGVRVERHPADWNGPAGKAAGFARNQAMVDTYPSVVLAFIRNSSKGATHCAEAAERAGLPVLRFVDSTPVKREAPERQPMGIPLKEFRMVDTSQEAGRGPAAADDDMPSGFAFPTAAEMEAAGTGCCGGYRAPDNTWSPCQPCPIVEARAQHADVTVPDGEASGLVAALADELAAVHEANPIRRIADLLPEGSVEGAVEGAVEDVPGAVALPMVPDIQYDADEQYASLMTGASKQRPPLTTAEVNGLICRTFNATSVQQVPAHDLARLIAGLKAGAVGWR